MKDYKISNNICVIFDEIDQNHVPVMPNYTEYIMDGINVKLKPINCLSYNHWNNYGEIETFANIYAIPTTSITI